MTLILALGNSDQVIQVSDRRLSWGNRSVSEEANKAATVTFRNARLTFGFTGIAETKGFRTEQWLLDSLLKCAPPEYTAKETIERVRELASSDFRKNGALRSLSPSDRRLSVMFAGYIYHEHPPRIGYAILTNYQDFNTGVDSPAAWEDFATSYWIERRPLETRPTFIQRIGAWHAMVQEDVDSLRAMLETRKPSSAIVQKAVHLIREMSERPVVGATIGKQVTSIVLPSDPRQQPHAEYHTAIGANKMYFPATAALTGPDSGLLTMGMSVEVLRDDSSAPSKPWLTPLVGRNARCPCKSGKKYKKCCGRAA